MKLNIGAGHTKIEGYLNVDIDKDSNPNIIADIRKKIPGVQDNSVERIRMYGVLEHFSLKEIKNQVLPELRRILKVGGILEILVPNLEVLAQRYLYFLETGEIPHKRAGVGTSFEYDGADLNYWIMGAQMTEWDLHKTIFDYNFLEKTMSDAGFGTVKLQKIDHNLFGEFERI